MTADHRETRRSSTPDGSVDRDVRPRCPIARSGRDVCCGGNAESARERVRKGSPMSRQPQPWYRPHPPQQPVPDNPYASGGPNPPGPPSRGRFGRGPVIAAVVVLLLLVTGTVVYVVRGG